MIAIPCRAGPSSSDTLHIYQQRRLTIDYQTTVANNACAISLSGAPSCSRRTSCRTLEFTSSPAQEPMYLTGEVIEVTATLNQSVTFDGPPPVLLLQIGDNEREMTYVASESTRSSWVFRYTVTANDRDDDGMSFDHFALRGYADADLSNNRVINDSGHLVNAVSQIVSQRVSSKSDSTALVRTRREDSVHVGILAAGDGGGRPTTGRST